MNWDQIVKEVSPYIVKIETPSGSGTGFLFAFNEDKSLCGIATALHVIGDADTWQQPIKIHSKDFAKTAFLKETQRFISREAGTDSAVILLDPSNLDLPQVLIPLRPLETPISIGGEVGMLGFPAIAPYTLCFFAGAVSARTNTKGYFIDGVAINGVSGGPVVTVNEAGQTQFVGIVSAYRANRATGEALPGLLIAQDMSHFHDIIAQIKTLDEAKKIRAEAEAKKKKEEAENQTSRPVSSVETSLS